MFSEFVRFGITNQTHPYIFRERAREQALFSRSLKKKVIQECLWTCPRSILSYVVSLSESTSSDNTYLGKSKTAYRSSIYSVIVTY